MNIKEIKSLAQIMEASGLTALSVTEGDVVIQLERKPEILMTAPTATQPSCALPIYPLAASAEDSIAEESIALPGEPVVDFNHLNDIKSPMVGIFYSAASPDSDPFVSVGSKIKKGDVLCIIEAMKLMNEITAEQDGEIVDICVSTGQVVEFGQPLFKLF